MHTIVEGVDGSGKSTLIKTLYSHTALVLHPKASTSVGGPVDELDTWVKQETVRAKEPGIYDRHPIISEPIYGTVIRDRLPGMFAHPQWVQSIVDGLAKDHLMVWCIPPWVEVANNTMHPDQHMDGVTTHARTLYEVYRVLSRGWWPGRQFVYDYTKRHPLDVVDWYNRERMMAS